MKPSLPLFLLLLLTGVYVMAQESKSISEKESGHKFSVFLAHAHLSKGIDESTGKRHWQSLPAWCLDYDYILNPKWHIGIHSDIITETYEVESYHETTLHRTRPVSCSLVGTYKLTHQWAFLLGAGGEFAKEENFFLSTIGIEYEYELPHNFELCGSVNYQLKWDAYDTYLIGIGISKIIN